MTSQNFENKSYQSHEAHFKDFGPDGPCAGDVSSWLDLDTADAWRHERIYKSLDPLIIDGLPQKWLTVGDGRYGLDAQYLARKGENVVASDISETLLKIAESLCLISAYSKENAEELSFGDQEFDFVLCKDAYHHFPKPMKALYEMLRVARRGVVLIEPSDHDIHGKVLDSLQRVLVKVHCWLSGKDCDKGKYESSGNYVYRASKHELTKVALGLDLPAVAFKGINDYYHPNMIHEKVNEKGPYLKRAAIAIKSLDLLTKLKLRDHRLVATVLIKDENFETEIRELEKANFKVVHLSRNPYL